MTAALVYSALAGGAVGYVSKRHADAGTVRAAILDVAAGRTVVSPELMGCLAGELRLHAARESIHLTRREQDIVRLVALGYSAPRIGVELSLSQSTVKTHLRSLYEKLGVSDRAAAVAQAMKQGLVESI